jgi:hypothetical protein
LKNIALCFSTSSGKPSEQKVLVQKKLITK